MEKITNARIKEEYLRIKHKSGATILLYPMKGYSTAYALFATKYGSVDTTFKTNEDPDFVTVPEALLITLNTSCLRMTSATHLICTQRRVQTQTHIPALIRRHTCSAVRRNSRRICVYCSALCRNLILQTLPLLRSRGSSGRKSECTRTIPVGEYFSTACRQCTKRTP